MFELNFIDLNKNKSCKRKIKKLYYEAFPKNERVPFIYLKLFAKKNKATFLGIYDKESFVGLIYNICYKDIVYIYYLATEPDSRGKGYGSKILEAMKNRYNQSRIILMAEEINEKSDNHEERIQRKRFYNNNGFRDFGYKVKEAGVVYDMLGCNKEVSHEEYKELMKNYWGTFFKNILKWNLLC